MHPHRFPSDTAMPEMGGTAADAARYLRLSVDPALNAFGFGMSLSALSSPSFCPCSRSIEISHSHHSCFCESIDTKDIGFACVVESYQFRNDR